ncbi:hypothetical protein FRC06_007978 [Ceratobasidium sp. 370]|nr:hypothetical protein FRC06_007978 [Ceratobasidium sp. 370]
MHILQLPTDVFIIVFSYMSGRDLVTCKQVCRSFRSLFKASTQLQYKFALARAGLVDGIIKYSMEDRLRLLRQLEQNWYPLELKPRRQLKVLYSSPCMKSEVSSGFVVSGIISRNSNWFQELQIYRLPSYLPDLKAKLWKHQLAEKHVQYFKADPVQDLLVLLESTPVDHYDDSDVLIRIHLRALSSNKPHPTASLPCLELSKSHLEEYTGWRRYPHQNFGMRIYLDILAILAKSDGVDPDDVITPREILMIWQWTSGQLLATLSSTSEMAFSDFTFIKRDQLLLAHSRSSYGPSLSVVPLICGKPYLTFPNHSIAPARHYSQQVILRLPAPPACTDQCLDIPFISIINDPTPCPQYPAIPQNSPVPLFAPDSSQESAMIALSIPVVLQTPQRGPTPTVYHTLLFGQFLMMNGVRRACIGYSAHLGFSTVNDTPVRHLTIGGPVSKSTISILVMFLRRYQAGRRW